MRDKVATEARGEEWSLETSPAKNYQSFAIPRKAQPSGKASKASSGGVGSQASGDWTTNGGGEARG